MRRVYGRPPGVEKPYHPDIYCALCNRVPINEGTIGKLYPLPVKKMNLKGELEDEEHMVCLGCIGKIETKFRDHMARLFRLLGRRKPPPESGEGEKKV